MFHFDCGHFTISDFFQYLYLIQKIECDFILFFVLSECQNYGTLNSADRKVTYTTYHAYCDYSISHGWYRFDGAAGSRMASSCQPEWRCGTHVAGWLRGGHPSVANGQVNRTVCFHWSGNCCQGSTNIQVRNCGSYYVYYLSGTPTCNLRYCGSD